jgi:hypothetical protein
MPTLQFVPPEFATPASFLVTTSLLLTFRDHGRNCQPSSLSIDSHEG